MRGYKGYFRPLEVLLRELPTAMRSAGAAERLRQRPGHQGLIHRPRTGADGLVYKSLP